jgi:hypothetical protein
MVTLSSPSPPWDQRRPTSARLLDFEEARLPFDADIQRVGERFGAIVLEMLARPDLPRQPDQKAAGARRQGDYQGNG